MEMDAPDVAPLDKGGIASQRRNENFDESTIPLRGWREGRTWMF
jgi:hypothetical protein